MNIGLGNVRVKGISGKMYTFRAYPLETEFTELGAVYFISNRNPRQDGKILHSRIYCGETSNLSARPHQIELSTPFTANHANCICILPKEDERQRTEIEKDIHQKYKFLC